VQKKFKLQKVLDFRILQLEQEKAKLGELMSQEQKLIAEIQRLTDIIRQKSQEMADEQSTSDFAMTQMYEKYIARLGVDRRNVGQKLAEHRKLVQKQKLAVAEAYKKKRVMDELESRHKKEYAEYMETQEQKILEDIVITRAATATVK
jgi:flagellar export protein FliJ